MGVEAVLKIIALGIFMESINISDLRDKILRFLSGWEQVPGDAAGHLCRCFHRQLLVQQVEVRQPLKLVLLHLPVLLFVQWDPVGG